MFHEVIALFKKSEEFSLALICRLQMSQNYAIFLFILKNLQKSQNLSQKSWKFWKSKKKIIANIFFNSLKFILKIINFPKKLKYLSPEMSAEA